MIVDSHLHVWRAITDHPNPSVTAVSPASDVPLELFSEYMTEHEVERAVLVQPLYPGEDNSYVAECAATDPDKFAAVCVVDPGSAEAPARLEYWGSQRGCKGLRLRPLFPPETACFGDPATFSLWERARELGIVISVLAGPDHLSTLENLVSRFPDVSVVVDHMAHPAVAKGIQLESFRTLLDLAKYSSVVIKVSGHHWFSQQSYPYIDCDEIFRTVYERYGAERLMWGSDFPHVLLKCGYRRALMLLQRACPYLRSVELDLIMGGNANRLYWR